MEEALIAAAVALLLAAVPAAVRIFTRLAHIEARLDVIEDRQDGFNDALVDTITAAHPDGKRVARVYELEDGRLASKAGRRRLPRQPGC